MSHPTLLRCIYLSCLFVSASCMASDDSTIPIQLDVKASLRVQPRTKSQSRSRREKTDPSRIRAIVYGSFQELLQTAGYAVKETDAETRLIVSVQATASSISVDSDTWTTDKSGVVIRTKEVYPDADASVSITLIKRGTPKDFNMRRMLRGSYSVYLGQENSLPSGLQKKYYFAGKPSTDPSQAPFKEAISRIDFAPATLEMLATVNGIEILSRILERRQESKTARLGAIVAMARLKHIGGHTALISALKDNTITSQEFSGLLGEPVILQFAIEAAGQEDRQFDLRLLESIETWLASNPPKAEQLSVSAKVLKPLSTRPSEGVAEKASRLLPKAGKAVPGKKK